MEPSIDEIKSVVWWIIEHPDHYNKEEFKGSSITSRIEIWYRFLHNPKIINEYENPIMCEMKCHPVINGCTHIFGHGKRCGSSCGSPVFVTTNKCCFHEAVIFSESLRTYIKQLNVTVDSYWN